MSLCCESILIVPLHTRLKKGLLKKGLLLIALCGLLYLGTGLVEGFLPYEWRHAIDQRFESIFPGPVYAPHPNIDWEFELDFREHPWHRLIQYLVLGVLTIGDAYLISRAWRAFRKT
jgi:hypothetical protein